MTIKLLAEILLAASMLRAGTIEGRVVNPATHLGIEGVSIAFFTGRGPRYETTSGAQGVFRIADVAEGNYAATFERSGYEPKSTGLDLDRGSDVPLRVSQNAPAAITIEMQPITQIRGYITNPDGKPAEDVAVELTGPLTNDRRNAMVKSNRDGSYSFDGVLTGSFSLVARVKRAPVLRGEERIATVTTYWPSATDPSAAQKLIVSGDVPVSSFDIQLQSRPVYRVRGTVLTPDGKPSSGSTVELRQIRAPGVQQTNGPTGNSNLVSLHIPIPAYDTVDQVRVSQTGEFEFSSVLEGDFAIRATGPHDPLKPANLSGQVNAPVNRANVENLEIRLQASFGLDAKIEIEGIDPQTQKPSRSGMMLFAILLVPLEGNRAPAPSISQPNGILRYEQLFPGQYKLYLQSSLTATAYVAHVFLGSDDMLGQIINLDASSPPIRIVVKQGGGSIRGSIEREASGIVVLLPGIGFTVEAPRSIVIKDGKEFAFPNLPPGEYYLLAFDRIDPARLADPLFTASLIPRAKRVQLDEKSSESLELPLNRWPE